MRATHYALERLLRIIPLGTMQPTAYTLAKRVSCLDNANYRNTDIFK